jgi:endonuclease I
MRTGSCPTEPGVLFLDGKGITAVPAANAFEGMGRVDTIALGGNKLTSLPSGVFSGLSSLRRLYLSGNALVCVPLSPSAKNALTYYEGPATLCVAGHTVRSEPIDHARGCDVVAYYASIDAFIDRTRSQLKAALQELVSSPHMVIPYTHGTKADTWDALKDLDADPANASNVVLIYKQTSEPADKSGVASGWNREHLWPQSYGVGSTGADTSDVHALRPADWNVNAARGNLPFSWCNVSTKCRDVPAHPEAHASTGKDSSVFMPPVQVRGDVARALMYMAVRYDGSDKDTTALRLADCPCPTTSTMGVLSVLLQWHALDPPSPLEIARNDRVCRKYQGNRNPFVDKPLLAARVFGGGGRSCVWDTGPLCAPAADAEGVEALQDRTAEETEEKKRQGGVGGGVLAGLVVACVVCSVCCAAISALWYLRRKLQKERASSDDRRELEMIEMREYRGDSTEQPSV